MPSHNLSLEKQDAVDKIVAIFDSWIHLRLASLAGKPSDADGTPGPVRRSHNASFPSNQHDKGNDNLFKLLSSQGDLGSRGLVFGTSLSTSGENGEQLRDAVSPAIAPEASKPAAAASRQLACPFLKHDPKKYRKNQSCAWPSWTTVHRVKEHLYRRHLLPKWRCNRCRKNLKSQTDLTTHQRMAVPCEIRAQEHQDGIDETQQQLLRSRKKSPGQLSEEEKWAKVYQILFPDDTFLPSPYHDLSSDASYQQPRFAEENGRLLRSLEDYARGQLPSLMRPGLDALFNDPTGEAPSKDSIIGLAKHAFEHIIKTFVPEGAMQHPQEQPAAVICAEERQPSPDPSHQEISWGRGTATPENAELMDPSLTDTSLILYDLDNAFRDAVIDSLQDITEPPRFLFDEHLDSWP